MVAVPGLDHRCVPAARRHQVGVGAELDDLTVVDDGDAVGAHGGGEAVGDEDRRAALEEHIERLPDGIHTPCHERGVALSSGERQLLALARAFLARPRVLVLDEATSNLDLLSEAKIEHALDVLLEGRTAIVIAHRLATAMRADRLAVVHDGRIVELGSHDELVGAGGRYAAMYATWERHTAGTPT